jgi:UDP:flavonoid glycosyltransferase YjiC (YdhE family)
MIEKGPVSVLVSPLDWGLGHATRCIPIVKELITQGARVVIAANADQKTLLNPEFPQVEFVDIPGYHIRYKRGFLLKWGLFLQFPFILSRIRKEKNWLDKLLQDHSIDAVISDNRYGLYNKKCHSVFITHQLQIQSGIGFSQGAGRWPLAIGRWTDRKLLKWNYKLISKFSRCWIPDQEAVLSTAGNLSHPAEMPSIPVRYIGILSRFHSFEKNIRKNSLLILMSGPEPQRTEFENILFSQLANSVLNTVVLRGLPGSDQQIPIVRDNIQIWNHVPANVLNELMNNAQYIVARSGYSTIMDLLTVRKNAILVPTPGQTEQEYLGRYMQERKWMYSVAQKNFNLEEAINSFNKAQLILPDMPDTNLHDVVKEFLKELSQRKNEHAKIK